MSSSLDATACVVCGGVERLLIDRARQPSRPYSNGRVETRVHSFVVPKRALGVIRYETRRDTGYFELCICTACDHTEWYARDIEELARRADVEGSGVRRVRARPLTNPARPPSRERCPRCHDRSCYAIAPARQMDGRALCVHSYLVPDGRSRRKRIDVGYFDLAVCAACGLTQWFAREIEPLLERADRGDPELRRAGTEPDPA